MDRTQQHESEAKRKERTEGRSEEDEEDWSRSGRRGIVSRR